MANHEARIKTESVDLLLAFARKKDDVPIAKCHRVVIRNFEEDLAILEAKLKVIGGTWRIHKTVNSRDTEKARKWLIKKLIDNPEYSGCVDSLWRTALLQKDCIYGEKKFLLDVDTKESYKLNLIRIAIPQESILQIISTPAGYHLIMKPFDTREVCKLDYVTLIRDGYSFVKKVGD